MRVLEDGVLKVCVMYVLVTGGEYLEGVVLRIIRDNLDFQI